MLIHKQSPSAVMSYNLCHPSFFSWNHHLPSQGLFQVHDLTKLAMLYWQIGSLSCQQDIFVLSFVLLSFPPLPDLVQLTRFMLSAAKAARMPLTSQAASTTTASRVFASPTKYTKFFICCALLKICFSMMFVGLMQKSRPASS
jgi:hypothetical protein